MDTFGLLIVLAVVVNVVFEIVLIVKYFNLCSNIDLLAKQKVGTSDFGRRFRFYVAAGAKEKAYDLLLSHMMNDDSFVESLYAGANRDKARAEMHRCYDKHFRALGLTLDFTRIEEYMKGE